MKTLSVVSLLELEPEEPEPEEPLPVPPPVLPPDPLELPPEPVDPPELEAAFCLVITILYATVLLSLFLTFT